MGSLAPDMDSMWRWSSDAAVLTLGTASPEMTISETGRPAETKATSAQTLRQAINQIPDNNSFSF